MFKRPWRAYRLLNHVPFDGCMLVFNANAKDWRIKASDFARQAGLPIRFHVHAITGASRAVAHVPALPADLYITLEKREG